MQIIKPDVPYIISTNTLVLQTIRKESRLMTLIMEKDNQFTHPRKALHLIRASCRHYGTSLKVATHNAKNILNNRHKVPIVVAFDHGTPLIMIPTLSTASEQNIWIAFHAIVNIKPEGAGCTIIELTNQHFIKVDSSETTIQRQIALAYLLQRDYKQKFSQFGGAWIT
ncbi:competence protein ComK [Sporosarcina ureilytica]|uniref:Competence protein n=1 Tax=Sporosarcina ureilytica TaxID=298596 RepID=A0A1D8JIK1_9BACL|nr:competence protein ComK [Sporosarcina ureilytica]AOV08538.1 hypothetical protein BI350_14005 [Sporosarcina ureilytica]